MSSSSLSQSGSHHSSSVDLSETELTLGLPGTKIAAIKRGFSDTVDLHLATSSSTTTSTSLNSGNNLVPSSTPKGSVMVGWPPVRANRKKVMKSCKYVKVAVDGAPFLRKVDLEIYESYEHLLNALETMFGCLTIRNCNYLMNEKKFMDTGNVIEYMPTYEDKDGDWMLVGDVPWKMFVESCKRIRLMISSEDIHLAPIRTTSKSTSSSDKNNECVLIC